MELTEAAGNLNAVFLSIQAQDFIEESGTGPAGITHTGFLSIQAQDFIEERRTPTISMSVTAIPEHSSSGLH